MIKEPGGFGRRMISAGVIFSFVFLTAGAVRASALRTTFGEVVIKNLKIGQVYSLNQLINLPYRVLNSGDEPITIKIDVISISSEQARQGYEPIPDASWISLGQHEFDDVLPAHEAVTDVVISIPNDAKLLGRRFEADIWARTWSKSGMLQTGIQSRLLIHVASVPPSEEELKKKFVDTKLANLDFTMFPSVGKADDLPVGGEINLLAQRKVGIKIVNPNDTALHFRLRSVPNWEALLHLPDGFENGPEATWVRPDQDVIEVPPNSIKETALFINVPNEERFRNKAYLFPVSVEILEQAIAARAYYQLLIRTSKDKTVPPPAPTGGVFSRLWGKVRKLWSK